jgi:hypothetical protein
LLLVIGAWVLRNSGKSDSIRALTAESEGNRDFGAGEIQAIIIMRRFLLGKVYRGI